jgi:hypothetical protein
MRRNVALALCGLVVGLLLGEIALRLFGNYLPDGLKYSLGAARFIAQKRGIFVPDVYLGTKCSPNISAYVDGHPDFSYRVNTISLGFADIGFRDDGIDGKPYAVALGDSFVWGEGVNSDQTWVERLEKETGFDFANLGVNAYGSLQEERMLEKYGLALKPKLVLWAFFPNDFRDNTAFEKAAKKGLPTEKVASYQDDWLKDVDASLRKQSLAYNLLALPLAAEDSDGDNWERAKSYKSQRLDIMFSIDYWRKRLDLSQDDISHGWDLTQRALLQAKELTEQNGVTLVVVLIPFKEQTYWPIASKLVEDPGLYDVDKPGELVRNWCEEQGIRYVDLYPVFREHAQQEEQLYFRYDSHWNSQGHTLAAQTVRDYLVREGLLPD